jgi:hypothetical protein
MKACRVHHFGPLRHYLLADFRHRGSRQESDHLVATARVAQAVFSSWYGGACRALFREGAELKPVASSPIGGSFTNAPLGHCRVRINSRELRR